MSPEGLAEKSPKFCHPTNWTWQGTDDFLGSASCGPGVGGESAFPVFNKMTGTKKTQPESTTKTAYNPGVYHGWAALIERQYNPVILLKTGKAKAIKPANQ